MRLRTVTTFLLLILWSLPAPGQTLPANSADIVEAHHARLAAILRGDFDTLEKMLADDFIVTFPNGTVGGKADYIGGQRSGRILLTSATHEDERVKVYGDAAVITGRSAGTLLVNGKEQPLLIRYTHVYIRRDGQWLMVAQHSTPIPR
jgi:ketosteroid isomerase-like protein